MTWLHGNDTDYFVTLNGKFVTPSKKKNSDKLLMVRVKRFMCKMTRAFYSKLTLIIVNCDSCNHLSGPLVLQVKEDLLNHLLLPTSQARSDWPVEVLKLQHISA